MGLAREFTSSSTSAGRKTSSIVVAPEGIQQLLVDGLDALCMADWDEIESHTDVFAYAPDWDRARYFERQGMLKIVSVRAGRELVGYSGFYLMPHMHARHSLHAINDVIYLVPEWRRGPIGLRLIGTAERHLKAAGARRITYAVRPSYPRTGALLEKLGYTLFESIYAKVLG